MSTQQAHLPWHLKTDTCLLGMMSGITGVGSSYSVLAVCALLATSQTLAMASALALHPMLQKLVSLQSKSSADEKTEVHGMKWSIEGSP